MALEMQYFDGTNWVPLRNAQFDHVLEELSGQEELSFVVANTAGNRLIFESLPPVRVLYNGSECWPASSAAAAVSGIQYSPSNLTISAYLSIYLQLKQAQPLTKNYDNVSASAIAADICALAGVGVGVVPSTLVSTKYQNANPLKALQDLAAQCGSDYFADSTSFNIGTRDATVQTLGYVGNSSRRGIDYSRQISQVIINGVDASGLKIQGSAGLGGATAVFTEKKASDGATLNALAAFRLQSLNNPSNGNSLICVTDEVYAWHPGQYISASRPDLALDGSYIIQRITKNSVTSTVEIDVAMPQMDVLVQQKDQSESDMSTYPLQPDQVPTMDVDLSQLIGLWHLNEGSGKIAFDSSKKARHGTITNGSWIAASTSKALSFNGSTTKVALGKSIDFEGKHDFTIGCRFVLSDTASHYLINKDLQFYLYQQDGWAVFACVIGGYTVDVSSLLADSIVTDTPYQVFVTYDGASIKIYLNGKLAGESPQTGNLDHAESSPGTDTNVYVGAGGYSGVIGEVLIFDRALSAREVQELFMYPVLRLDSQKVAEGDFSNWTNVWVKQVATDWGLTTVNTAVLFMDAYEEEDALFIGAWTTYVYAVKISDGSLIGSDAVQMTQPQFPNVFFSASKEYYVFVKHDISANKDWLYIVKRGTNQQQTDLSEVFSTTSSSLYVCISSNGKYILVGNYTTHQVALYKAD